MDFALDFALTVFFLAEAFFLAAALAALASALARLASVSRSTSPGFVTVRASSISAPHFQHLIDLGRWSSSPPHSGQGRSLIGGLFTAPSHSGYRSQP